MQTAIDTDGNDWARWAARAHTEATQHCRARLAAAFARTLTITRRH